MARLRERLQARGHVPEPDHRLGTGRSQRLAIRGECQRPDPLRRDSMQLLTLGDVPQVDARGETRLSGENASPDISHDPGSSRQGVP